MTRIATYGQAQMLLQNVLQNELRVFEGERKLSSGIKSRDYKGIARDVTTLSSAKSLLSGVGGYIKDNNEVSRRLELYDLNLTSLRDIAQGLRDDTISAINSNTGIAYRNKIDGYFDTTVSLLGAKDNGRFIFAGSRTDTQPVVTTVQTSAGLAALTQDITTNTTTAFTNNSIKQQAQLDSALTLTYGILAEDVADELMEGFRRLMRFDNGTENFTFATSGPFTAPMNEDQRDFLIGEINRLNAVIEDIDSVRATNGVNMRTLEDTQNRLERDKFFMAKFTADIEDADMGIAISRLAQDEAALEASFRMLAQLSRLTLMDFI
jgi:flagellar hook-associated protein 3 FlgL